MAAGLRVGVAVRGSAVAAVGLAGLGVCRAVLSEEESAEESGVSVA
jgi:hypothetical protein